MAAYLPILYEAGETAFDSLGLGYCDCISCLVKEVRNSLEDYQVEMVYPITGALAGEFTEGRILLVLQDDTDESLADRETFTIYSTYVDTMAGTITVYAMQEAVYRAKYFMLSPMSAKTESPTERASQITNVFAWYQADAYVTLTTDCTGSYDFPQQNPISLLDAIQGNENSMLNICGGELKCHRRKISLLQSRGSDNGAIVRYGKNLKSLTIETNAADTYTGIIPYWTKTDSDTGEVTTITGDATTGGQVIYTTAQETSSPHVIALDVTSDLKEPDDYEGESGTWVPTAAEVIAAGKEKLASVATGEISVVYSAEVAQDPADPAIELCDTVLIQHPAAGINIKAKCTGRVFNPLLRRHESLTIGSVEKSLAQSIKDLVR